MLKVISWARNTDYDSPPVLCIMDLAVSTQQMRTSVSACSGKEAAPPEK